MLSAGSITMVALKCEVLWNAFIRPVLLWTNSWGRPRLVVIQLVHSFLEYEVFLFLV